MKKTSSSQFELMVAFMEQHGDASKPCTNVKERVAAIHRWDELTTMLNDVGNGDIKTCEKWKKVWSDYKNNTKKKVARLHKAAHATGDGPAAYAKLSDLEQRVLNLMGLQVATGTCMEEAELLQLHNKNRRNIQQPTDPEMFYSQLAASMKDCLLESSDKDIVQACNVLENWQNEIKKKHCLEKKRFKNDIMGKPEKQEYTISIENQLVEYPENPDKPWPSAFKTKSATPFAFEEVHILGTQPSDEPSQSTHTAPPLTGPADSPLHVTVDVKEESPSPTFSMLSSPDLTAQEQPTLSSPTPSHAQQTISHPERHSAPHRTTRTRVRGYPRRLSQRLRNTEQAMEQFLHAEQQWRNFKMEQHRDYMDLRREQNRIRQMEVQTQRVWQALGTRALDLIEKFINK